MSDCPHIFPFCRQSYVAGLTHALEEIRLGGFGHGGTAKLIETRIDELTKELAHDPLTDRATEADRRFVRRHRKDETAGRNGAATAIRSLIPSKEK